LWQNNKAVTCRAHFLEESNSQSAESCCLNKLSSDGKSLCLLCNLLLSHSNAVTVTVGETLQVQLFWTKFGAF